MRNRAVWRRRSTRSVNLIRPKSFIAPAAPAITTKNYIQSLGRMKMNNDKSILVVGLGEVGKPLFQLLSKHYKVVGIDIQPPSEPVGEVDVLHICFPFEIR